MKKTLAVVLTIVMLTALLPVAGSASTVHYNTSVYSDEAEVHEMHLPDHIDARIGYEGGTPLWEHTFLHGSVVVSDESIVTAKIIRVPPEAEAAAPFVASGIFDVWGVQYVPLKSGEVDVTLTLMFREDYVGGDASIAPSVSTSIFKTHLIVGAPDPQPFVHSYMGADITDDLGPFEFMENDVSMWRLGVQANAEDSGIGNLSINVISSNPAVATIVHQSTVVRADGDDFVSCVFTANIPGDAFFVIEMTGTNPDGTPWEGYKAAKHISVNPGERSPNPQHPVPVESLEMYRLANQYAEEKPEWLEHVYTSLSPALMGMEEALRSITPEQVRTAGLVMAGTALAAAAVVAFAPEIAVVAGVRLAIEGVMRLMMARTALVLVSCPVELQVLDAEGNLLATMKTDDAEFIGIDGLVTWASGDRKFLLVPRDRLSAFQYRLVATEDGTMSLDGFYTDADAEVERDVAYADIPIMKGQQFEFMLNEEGQTQLFTLTDGVRAQEIDASDLR